MKRYYDRRAPEYDTWYLGTGSYAHLDRPRWLEEMEALEGVIAGLPPARTLDVACGTGFLTRWLPGNIVGVDQSEAMIAIARSQAPRTRFVRGDALALPFPGGSFARAFTGHFYGHLEEPERARFLAEARRVAAELVVVDSALGDDVEPEEWQERVVSDGSRYLVFKRYFTGAQLAEELSGGEVLLEGRWFVVVRA